MAPYEKANHHYQICHRCVMDNRSDNKIIFDNNGVCNYCKNALAIAPTIYFPNEKGKKYIEALVAGLKDIYKNNKYDCIMGLSGGLDSSYLAYLGYKWRLRIFAVHIDDGFDTQISKDNLQKLCAACKIDIVTIKPDAKQFYALTKAYMNAGVPNLAIPQDNILLAELHKMARKTGIRHFLSGGNFALECILQQGNTYTSSDVVNIKDINKKFGTKPINNLAFISDLQLQMDKYFYKIESIRPLNFIDYNRDRAFNELKEFCDFQYYGRKHLENILTAFIQLYWFYHKFGVDKRTSHLSSMILSGQMTREEALKELDQPIYDKDEMEQIIRTVIEKLGLSREELNAIMKSPVHQHTDYKVSQFPNILRALVRIIRRFK